MIVNPICHWAGGPAPLLVYAPGLPEAGVIGNQWGDGPQLPVEQPILTSAAQYAAESLPTPSHILTFQEAQGVDVADLVGGTDYDLVDSGNASSPAFRMPARGLWIGATNDGSNHKAIEFQDLAASQHRLAAKTGTEYNFGAQSWAMFIIYRHYETSGTTKYICGKAGSLVSAGWHLTTEGYFRVEDQSGHSVGCSATATHNGTCGGGWNYALVFVDLSVDEAGIIVNGDVDARDISAFDSSTDHADPYFIGWDAGVGAAPAGMQVAYQSWFEGAQAEAIAAAANRLGFMRQMTSQEPFTNCPIDAAPSDAGYYSNSSMYISGEDDTEGTIVAAASGIAGVSGSHQQPLKYETRLSRTNKLGSPTQLKVQNKVMDGDQFSVAGWTLVAATADKPSVVGWDSNAGTMPNGMRGWLNRLKVTGASGHARTANTTVVAGSYLRFSIFVQRAYPEVTDVTGGNIQIYDVTHSAWFGAVTNFTATEKWQEVVLEIIVPVGCTTIRAYIMPGAYTGTDRYCNVCYATLSGWANGANPGAPAGPIFKKQFWNDHAWPTNNFYNTAAGVSIKGAQGEIEAVVCGSSDMVTAWDVIVMAQTGASSKNIRNIQIAKTSATHPAGQPYTYGALRCYAYDNEVVPVLIGGVCEIDIADTSIEHVLVFRWNNAGLPSGNNVECTLDGGAPVGFVAAGFSAADTITTIRYGHAGTYQSITNNHEGVISSIRIWENPR